MEAFKNNMSQDVVEILAYHLDRQLETFDKDAFCIPLIQKLPSLELKERTQIIADAVHRILPTEFERRSEILIAMLHPDDTNHAHLQSDKNGICGWALWPLTMVLGLHGIENFDGSLLLLKEMTKRGTAEFDIRPFLEHDQDRALNIIATWAHDENLHVRRLSSEGTRPRLPWGAQLKNLMQNPTPTLPILNALRDDPEEYVRRSVANHLNDISKDHPSIVVEVAENWMKDASVDRQKLVRHASRTLIKKGRSDILSVFGYNSPEILSPLVKVLTPVVKVGEFLDFSVDIRANSSEAQLLLIDYEIHFLKAKGTVSPKVFKWKTFELQGGEQTTLKRRHSMRTVTTRRFYPGPHAVSVMINGVRFEDEPFELLA